MKNRKRDFRKFVRAKQDWTSAGGAGREGEIYQVVLKTGVLNNDKRVYKLRNLHGGYVGAMIPADLFKPASLLEAVMQNPNLANYEPKEEENV